MNFRYVGGEQALLFLKNEVGDEVCLEIIEDADNRGNWIFGKLDRDHSLKLDGIRLMTEGGLSDFLSGSEQDAFIMSHPDFSISLLVACKEVAPSCNDLINHWHESAFVEP